MYAPAWVQNRRLAQTDFTAFAREVAAKDLSCHSVPMEHIILLDDVCCGRTHVIGLVRRGSAQLRFIYKAMDSYLASICSPHV